MTNRSKLYKANDEFSLMDNTFMSAVFDDDKKTVALLLNIILNRSDMEVIAQRIYNNLLDRSIRIDMFSNDRSDKVYDIEVRRSSEGNDCRRVRYNSSMIDTRLLSRG